MKKVRRDRFLPYAEPYLTRSRILEVVHVSPAPTVLLAGHPDQRLPAPVLGPGPWPGLVQLRHGAGPLVLVHHRGRQTRRPVGAEVRHRKAAPARLVLRGGSKGRNATR